jgi:methylthioribulose-1-phosphate dehydratase
MSTAKDSEALVRSEDPEHPANHICSLCAKFYNLGWVTGTGGGTSIRHGDKIYIAPSGVQKELMKPTDMFVMDFETKEYLRKPQVCSAMPLMPLMHPSARQLPCCPTCHRLFSHCLA